MIELDGFIFFVEYLTFFLVFPKTPLPQYFRRPIQQCRNVAINKKTNKQSNHLNKVCSILNYMILEVVYKPQSHSWNEFQFNVAAD